MTLVARLNGGISSAVCYSHERSIDKYTSMAVLRMNITVDLAPLRFLEKVGEFIEVDYADLRNRPSISMIFWSADLVAVSSRVASVGRALATAKSGTRIALVEPHQGVVDRKRDLGKHRAPKMNGMGTTIPSERSISNPAARMARRKVLNVKSRV